MSIAFRSESACLPSADGRGLVGTIDAATFVGSAIEYVVVVGTTRIRVSGSNADALSPGETVELQSRHAVFRPGSWRPVDDFEPMTSSSSEPAGWSGGRGRARVRRRTRGPRRRATRAPSASSPVSPSGTCGDRRETGRSSVCTGPTQASERSTAGLSFWQLATAPGTCRFRGPWLESGTLMRRMGPTSPGGR